MFEDDVKFSEEAKTELRALGELVMQASGKAMEALANNDKVLAQEAWDICRQVKKAQKEIRKNHIVRLNEKRCDPVAGFMMMEILINLKRVSDHSKNISQIVLGVVERRGNSSVVEHLLAKEGVASSNLVFRSMNCQPGSLLPGFLNLFRKE